MTSKKLHCLLLLRKKNVNIVQLLLNNKKIDINNAVFYDSYYCYELSGGNIDYIIRMNKRYLKEKFELNVIEDINEEEEDGFNEEEEDSFSEEECWPKRNNKYYSIITN